MKYPPAPLTPFLTSPPANFAASSSRSRADSRRSSRSKPRALILFRTLCRREKSELLCNRANPNSLAKIPGWGLQSLLACSPTVPRPTTHYPLSALSYFQQLTNRPLRPIDLHLLPFQSITNRSLSNCFVFKSIQIAGVSPIRDSPWLYFFRLNLQLSTVDCRLPHAVLS